MKQSINIEIVGEWIDELMGCPDQCSLNLKVGESFYVLYLRSRFAPWTAQVIETDETFDMLSTDNDLIDLDIPIYGEGVDRLEEIKQTALNKAKEYISQKG